MAMNLSGQRRATAPNVSSGDSPTHFAPCAGEDPVLVGWRPTATCDRTVQSISLKSWRCTVPTDSESARALAVRLRQLRQTSWPDIKITQAHLAEAFGELKSASVPLISSWERQSDPALPPPDRLTAYATFFC